MVTIIFFLVKQGIIFFQIEKREIRINPKKKKSDHISTSTIRPPVGFEEHHN
jgi:hypothetical protein